VQGTGITLLLAACFTLSSVLSYGQDTRINANGYEVKIHKKDLPGDQAAKTTAQLSREHKMKLLSEQFAEESLNKEVVKGETVVVEDFETGDFSKFPWQFTGASPWVIDAGVHYEGNFAARSGQIYASETSGLKIWQESPVAGDISFYLKVSCEPYYDYLAFYLDNTLVEKWDGEVEWLQASFPVTPGNHLYEWRYCKDNSVSFGQDCAWVDYIVFPGNASGLIADFTADPTLVCEGELVQFTDQSSGSIIMREWSFPGGIPSLSYEQNPIVQYNTAGSYDVSLTVSNGITTDTKTKPGYITVEECTGADIEDFETGDFSKFDWQFAGDADWTIETVDPYEGFYCARSGQIGSNGSTILYIEVDVPAADHISFYKKVSSEIFYDKLKFYIDDILVESWAGDVAWDFHEYPVLPGVHTFKWEYMKDYTVVMGSDCAWLDYIRLPIGQGPPPPPPVSEDFETGDFSKFPWTFSGDQPWVIDNVNPHLGQFSARSGAIGDAQSSGLEVTLNILSDGDLSFYGTVSSEYNYDYLAFYIDDIQVDQWSGDMDWMIFTYPVTAGMHTFKWVYVKDFIVAMGSDCARIDDITFPPYEVPCPPVVAGFDYTQSQTNPFTFYFISTSQGDISAWAWDFGDGGTSTLEDPAHTFAAPGSYNVCLTVVNACNGDTDTWCEVIVVEDPCPPCVAAFTWIQDPGDPYTFYFNDASQGEIATWWWEFGDGTTSTEQFPSHTYALVGSYNVCLTITSACSYCMDTYCETVTIDVPNLYNLGGTVFAGNFPIDEGFAYLFKIENGQIVDVFASFIHEYGYYDFFQLEEGTYILKAELSPNSPLYNLYIPTYYVSVPNWVNADIINLQANTWNADVHMIPISNLSPGSGIIAGQVMKGEYEFFSESSPVGNVEILLSDDNGQLYTCTYSDADGYFGFPDLAFATYRVTAEVTGKYSTTAVVTLDENNPSVTDIFFFIQGDQISLSIPGQEAANGISIGEVYPNPAREQASLDINIGASADMLVSVFDQTGKMVMKEEFAFSAGLNRVTLQTGQWSTGLYTVKILSNNGRLVVRKLIKP
jgi:PKD repeat protein